MNNKGLITGVLIIFLSCLFVFNKIAFKEQIQASETQSLEAEGMAEHKTEKVIGQREVKERKKEVRAIKKTAHSDLQSLKPLVKNLQQLEKCSKTENCNYPDKSPKSYPAAVNKDIIKTLASTHRLIQSKNLQDPRITNFAKKFLYHDHDLIKLEALKILSTQKQDEKLIPIIFSQVFSSPNPRSSAFSLQLLSGYKEPRQKRIINENLYKVLTQGGVYPALEITRNLDKIMDDSNRNYFIDALQKIEKQKISQRLHMELKKQLEL